MLNLGQNVRLKPQYFLETTYALLKELQNHNIIEQINSSPQSNPTYGTTYSNPLISLPKRDSIKNYYTQDTLLLTQFFALNYIDDILLRSNSKEHMFQPIE